MRTIIINGNVVTGDGKTLIENCSVIIQDDLIDSIMNVSYINYDPADQIVDAQGGFVVPGLINSHCHGVTIGPVFVTAGIGLPKARTVQNIKRFLLEGCTTLVNQDGFATMEEVEASRALTPVLIQTTTSHLPLHFEVAKRLNYGGLREEHMLKAEDMVRQGAIGIGEIGGTADSSYLELLYIPRAVKTITGIEISKAEAEAIKDALLSQPPDEQKALEVLARKGASSALKGIKEVIIEGMELNKLAVESCREAATTAKKLKVPFFMHNSRATRSLVMEFAREVKHLLFAVHSNYTLKPIEALETARVIKENGGWVEIVSGDVFRGRQLYPNHATTLALLDEGLADTISTDYTGGYWDPMIRTMEYAVEQKVISLPEAIALATGNVVRAMPNVAPNRGEIAAGKIADILILDRNRFSNVRTILIKGKVFIEDGRIIN